MREQIEGVAADHRDRGSSTNLRHHLSRGKPSSNSTGRPRFRDPSKSDGSRVASGAQTSNSRSGTARPGAPAKAMSYVTSVLVRLARVTRPGVLPFDQRHKRGCRLEVPPPRVHGHQKSASPLGRDRPKGRRPPRPHCRRNERHVQTQTGFLTGLSRLGRTQVKSRPLTLSVARL